MHQFIRSWRALGSPALGALIGEQDGGAADAEEAVGDEHRALVAKIPVLCMHTVSRSLCRSYMAGGSNRHTCVIFSVLTISAVLLGYT